MVHFGKNKWEKPTTGKRFPAKMYHFSCTLVSQEAPADPSPPPPLGTEYTSRNWHNFWTFSHHKNRERERKKGQLLIIITGNYASTIGFSNEHRNEKEKDNNAHIIIIPNDVSIIGNSNDHRNWRGMIPMIIIKLWSSGLWLSRRGFKFIYMYTAQQIYLFNILDHHYDDRRSS